MAVEVGVGCQSLGIVRVRDGTNFLGRTGDSFIVDGTFNEDARKKDYSGPESLRPILSRHVDRIRNTVAPLFDVARVSEDGFAPANARLPGRFSLPTQVSPWSLPTVNNASIASTIETILQQCTTDIYDDLDIPLIRSQIGTPFACVLYETTGSSVREGQLSSGAVPTLCATTTQINMVSATIEVSSTGHTTARIIRLPSDLFITEADYFNDTPASLDSIPSPLQPQLLPIMRYTLASNTNGGSHRHFISQRNSTTVRNSGFQYGSAGGGGGGSLVSMIGTAMVSPPSIESLSVLNAEVLSFSDSFSNLNVTRWMGAYGASFIQASIGYNAWASLATNQQVPFVISSTGGVKATCYKSPFALFFLPLVAAAVGVVMWLFYLAVVKKRVQGTQVVSELYGGMVSTVTLDETIKLHRTETLVWKMLPHPHLEHVSYPPSVRGPPASLVGYLKRTGQGGSGRY